MRVWVKGKFKEITIDDRIPYGTTTPLFLRAYTDSAYWPLFAEKMFAKIMVNYEMIGWGWMAEALQVFTGAPTVMLTGKSFSLADMWTALSDSDQQNYVMTGACMSGYQGLIGGHAYSVIGVKKIVDA